jgi:hypothetical protein
MMAMTPSLKASSRLVPMYWRIVGYGKIVKKRVIGKPPSPPAHQIS